MRREYKTGSKWAFWRWKDIYWNNTLYLRRLYIFHCPLGSIMLHWFFKPDQQRHLHDHPAPFVAFVLRGWYIEETKTGRRNFIEWFNYIPPLKQHRVSTISDPCPITLCFAGRRKRVWGFYTEDGFMEWDAYLEKYEGSTS